MVLYVRNHSHRVAMLSALSGRVFGEDVTVFGKQLLETQRVNQERRDATAAAKEADSAQGKDTASELGMDMDNDEVKHDMDEEEQAVE
jgi:hypothetical protein